MAWAVEDTPVLYDGQPIVGRPRRPVELCALPTPYRMPYAPLLSLPGSPHPVAPSPRHPVADQSPALLAKQYLDGRGLYRVFNNPEYRFYRDNAAPPAEGDPPFATHATLPHEPAAAFADGTWYLSVSYFNGVLDSGFLPIGEHGETYLRLDLSGGVEENNPPAAPGDLRLEQRAGGVIAVWGLYFQAGSLRADEWAIAYTTDGSTPAADAPDVTVAMAAAVHLEVLEYELPAMGHGWPIKVRVQTRRNDGTAESPDWVYSEGSTVLSITADATGPSAPRSGESWTGRVPEIPP